MASHSHVLPELSSLPVPGAGDLAAHLPHLRRVARRILGCGHLAEDAVQDALLALWLAPQRRGCNAAANPHAGGALVGCERAPASCRSSDPHAGVDDADTASEAARGAAASGADRLRRALVRAVIHRALHQRRSLLRRLRHEHSAAREVVECDNPLHLAWLAELRARVDGALGTLPRPQREAMCLRAQHGLDYAAIARRTRVPIGSVRSRLNRARRRLGDLLRSVEPEPGERHLPPP